MSLRSRNFAFSTVLSQDFQSLQRFQPAPLSPSTSAPVHKAATKDAALQINRAWIVEIAELEPMTRAEVGRVKAFMSRSVDRFRPPYGRGVIDSPRHCVFAGSSNQDAYLRDETGARRFWPVKCTSINIGALERDRDQLWAEAVAKYRTGYHWWL